MPLPDAATVTAGGSPSTNGGSQPAADRSLLIDGQPVTSSRFFASVKPAIGDVIGHASDAGIEGGFKQSGVRREMGVAGLEEFLERKTIAFPAVAAAGSA